MYLRSAKTDLEDAGESVDGMVESTPKLQALLKSIAGVDILQSDGTTFKSTYQILKELSEVWDNLTDVNKASVLEAIGGKRNANVTSALIKNFSEAEKVLATSQNSSGSALSENEKYLDSINGKISQLKAQFEDISRQILSSDTVKWTADLLQNVLKLVDGLAKTKTLLPIIFALIAKNKGLGIAGTDNLGNITVFGKTKEQRATNKYLGSVVDQNTFFGFKSPVLNLTSDELKTLKAFNAEIISGTAGQEAFEKHLSKSRDYVKNLGQELEVGAVSMQTIETATTGASTAMAVFNSLKAMALNFVVMAGIELAVAGIKWVIAQIPTVKKLGEDLSKINDELKSLKSESESLNSELKTTADRINELESKDSLTLVEENELAKLKQTNAEYKTQIQLKNDLIEKKTKDQKKTFAKYVKTQYLTDDTLYGGAEINAYNNQLAGWVNKKNNITRQYQSGKIDFATYDTELRKIDAAIESIQQKIINIADIRRSTEVGAILDILDSAKVGTEEYNDALEDFLDISNGYEEKLQGLYDNGYTYGSDEKTDVYIDQLNEVVDLYNKYKGNFDTLWDSVINRKKFAEAKKAIDELGEGFDSTQLANLMQTNEAVQTLVEYLSRLGLIDWQKILGDSFSKADKDANGYLDTSEMLTLNQEDLEKGLSGVANQFKEVSSETEEATEKMSDFLEATKSLTNKFTDIESKKSAIADMLAELRDDGGLSSKSMSSLFDDFSDVKGFEDYIRVLTSSKSSAKQLQDALNGLYGAYIDNQGILNDVTAETYDYTQARLKSLGVTNAEEVAISALAYSQTKAAISKGTLNTETVNSIKNQLIEKGASEAMGNQYIATAQSCINAQSAMVQAIKDGAKQKIKAFGIELSGIKSVAQAYSSMLTTIRKDYGAGFFGEALRYYGNERDAYASFLDPKDIDNGRKLYDQLMAYASASEDLEKAQAQLKNLSGQISGVNGISVNVPATETKSSKTEETEEEKHIKKFDNWYAQLKWQRDNNIIDETNFLQQLDYKYQNHYADRSKYLEEYAKYSQEVYEGFKKLYQDDLNAQKDSLEKQKDELKELADARKQALEDAKDEEDYKKDQSEKREEINKLKVLIASFRGTLSLSSQKKLRELQQQLKEKEEELNDFEKDKALERAKDQIDKEYESQEKAINEQIKGIDERLEQVNKDLPSIRSAIYDFAKKYGVTITRAYASGTSSVPAITQENGAEVIAGNIKRGQFTMLTPTSKVWNASATQALWDFANSPQGYLSSVMDKISSFKQKAMSMIYSQPVNVNVGGITVNGNADNQTVQKIKHSQKEQVEEILKTMKKLQ